MHPRFEPTSRRSTRAASSAAPQYAEGSGSTSSDTDTDEFRVEPREDRKRKNTDRGLDGDSSDEEQEIEEEEPVPPFQHQPGQGMHYGLLKTCLPNVPSYVSRVDYRGKGMTRKDRDERRVDSRGLPKVQYDHRIQTAFHMDFYSSVILTRNPMVAKSQWID